MDDDEWYGAQLMTWGFGHWRQIGGEAMVGFNARMVNYTAGSQVAYRGNGYVRPHSAPATCGRRKD